MTFEHENVNLWTTRNDMLDFEVNHCVSLTQFGKFDGDAEKLNRKRVLVTGVFHMDLVKDSGTVRFSACDKAAIAPSEIVVL